MKKLSLYVKIFSRTESTMIENFNPSLLSGKKWKEIFAERKRELIIVMEQGEIEKLWEVEDAGAGLRIRDGERFHYRYVTSLDGRKISEMIRDVESGEWKRIERESSYRCEVRKPFNSVEIARKIDILKSADSFISRYGSIVSFRKVVYKESLREIEVINSEGVHVYDIQPQVVFYVQVAVSDPERGMETGYEPVGRSGGFEVIEEISPENIAKIAVERALKNLKSDWAPAGRMPVVISSEAGGTIIHEAVGHGLEGDLVFNNLSVYAGKLGEQVASEKVTIIDDATLPCYRGSFAYDDEGIPSSRSVLIEKGVLKGYMSDLFYAEKLGVEPTGNGRRESYRFMPVVRMSNTFMLPGKDSVDDIVSSVDYGLFVKKMGGGEVNTVSGDFVFEVLEAHLIKNGRIAEPVRGATLIGNGPEILKKVDMVGNDLGFAIGTCGKEGQGVPVTDGMPTIRVPELTVGGRVK